MKNTALQRALQIQEDMKEIQKFADVAVNQLINCTGSHLHEALRKDASVDGLVSNLEALITVWKDSKLAALAAEFEAL